MSLRRSGINPLAYCGVEATQPPQFEMHGRAPTANDYISFNVGTIWLDISGLSDSPKVLPTNEQVYMLVSKNNKTATWVNFGGGDVETLTGDFGGVISPDASDNINLLGTHGINTLGAPASNKITTAIDNAITLGDLADVSGASALTLTTGNATITAGNLVLSGATGSWDTAPIINFPSNSNRISFLENDVYIGQFAGNLTATKTGLFNVGIGPFSCSSLTGGTQNVGIGNATLKDTTSGQDNIMIGFVAGQEITTGSSNIGVGTSCFDGAGSAGLKTGSNNIAIGNGAGSPYDGAESSNILLNNSGVITENNTLKIGSGTGAGAKELSKAFIHGIRDIETEASGAIPVLIAPDGQLGTTSSSIRYKENIEDMGEDSSIIMELRPVTFNFKKHPDVPAWGLIAEEVAEVFPQLAVYNKDGSVETVKYHEIAVLLLNELQKMSKRLAVLEKKLKG